VGGEGEGSTVGFRISRRLFWGGGGALVRGLTREKGGKEPFCVVAEDAGVDEAGYVELSGAEL